MQIGKEFELSDTVKSLVTASILAGAVLGALGCSFLAERLGRRHTLLIVSATFVVGALASAMSPNALSLSVSRLILGLAVGGATQTAPMYVAELSPSALRGRLVLCFQFAIGVGIVAATVLGAPSALSWRWTIGGASVPAAIMLGFLLTMPESPRWLVKHRDREDAMKVLEQVRPEGADNETELKEIEDLSDEEQKAITRGWGGLRKSWVRPAIVVGCGVAIFTHLSGIEMIIYYAPTILTDNGFSTSQALNVSVGLGVTYLIMMVVGLTIIDRVGRRRLALLMIPGAATALFLLGLIYVSGNGGPGSNGLIIACLIVFMFFNAGGLQLLGWMTGSEIFPLGVRPGPACRQGPSGGRTC